ncbi:Imp21p [Kluyveromyces lactis]|uniref:KLLA0A00440p n=1 Tax=Kluyveromyces lactis (strain ATCC 8585 / CBS 2359 / DSM 70799 / NBRC 1267 / NRRL Y-1140 / WM37) TaxID=284590 RepID=Q6CYH2_KLULA|nr:uncharacterized protein KLLA0_A00440g [Kluyveromyces lactis]CAH02605.1 KLLA0A00440p [Kluyveromyces lactis]|eukprot:XP_451017.1 uncharacterized protein KLLA0_A00440g [Kluyveromyces lactis]
MEEPGRGILNKKLTDDKHLAAPPAFPTIKIEEPEQRGRSRSKTRDTGISSSRSISRSASRVSIKDQAYLKWTILNKDPSERLHLKAKKGNTRDSVSPGQENGGDEDEDEDEEEFIEDREDDGEVSEEEQVSDVENEIEIDEHIDYDLGCKVLPNFVTPITQVLDSMKPWLAKNAEIKTEADKRDIKLEEIQHGIHRAVYHMSKGDNITAATSEKGHSFVVYLDQMDESFAEKIYALVYSFGSVFTNGDTLYIINQCDDDTNDMLFQMNRICDHIDYLFECTNGVGTLDKIDVLICSMYHPYPKQLLTEMAHSLQPSSIIIPLQTVLASLQNFITSVPMLVIRKKLKRSKRRGIAD